LSAVPDSVACVAPRWTANDVLALAPDAASQRAAAGLARPACWSDAGTAGDLVWGRFAGSGKPPYQTVVDLGGPAYRSPRAGPVLEVDTSGPVDVPGLAVTLTRLLGAEHGT
jgi:hypothetical protein